MTTRAVNCEAKISMMMGTKAPMGEDVAFDEIDINSNFPVVWVVKN